MADELIEGVSLKIGAITYVVPPLNFRALRQLRTQLAELAALDPAAREVPDSVYEAVIEVVHAAVKRNYPAISKEEIEGALDLGNSRRVIAAIMGASGLVQGAAPSGESAPGSMH